MVLVRGDSICLGTISMAEDFGPLFGLDLEKDPLSAEGCCHLKWSGKGSSSSQSIVLVATAGDEPRVANLEGEQAWE